MPSPADLPVDELLARMRWVRGLASALVRDADNAEDLAQDAWRLALEQPLRRGSSWRGWFAQVMKNRAVDQWYSDETRKPLEAQLPDPESPPTPEETLQRLETQQALAEAVKALDEPYRSTLLLRYFEGWTVRRIAIHEGVQSRAIESRLRRGRDLIRADLEQRGSIQSWATGLLLLAWPRPSPLLAVRGIAVGLFLVITGWVGWLMWPDSSGQDQAAGVTASGNEDRILQDFTRANPAAFGTTEMQRDPVVPLPTSLKFSVIDAGNGKPLSGVRVFGEFLDTAARNLGSVEWISDQLISFEVPIPRGARQVRLVTEGSATHAGVPAGRLYSWEDQSIDPLILIRTDRLRGELLGRVLGPDLQPVAGAEVGVWLRNHEGRGSAPERLIAVAEDGFFSMPLAMAEQSELFLVPLAPGHSALRSYRLTRERPANAYVENLELLLAPGRALSVSVEDKEGAPISGAEVVLWPSQPADSIPVFPLGQYEGRLQHNLRTNSAGKAPQQWIGEEAYSLAVRREGYAQQVRALAVNEASVTVVLPPAGIVMGQVRTPQGAPAPGVKVIVEGVGQEECQTDSEGRFRAPCPSQPGEEVRIILIPPAPHALQVWGPFQPEELSEPITCQLEPSQRLTARLVDADGELYLADPELRVEVSGGPQSREPNGDAQSAMSWARLLPVPRRNAFKAQPAAELKLDGLPLATYRVAFHGRDGLLAEAWVNAGAPPLDIVIGSYPDARATLTGRVRPAAGSAPLLRFRIQGQRLASADPSSLLPEEIGLDCEAVDGQFRMQGIPPGWWQLQVLDLDSNRAWGLAAVQLEANRSLELAPFLDGTFEGRLTILLPDGAPAAGLRVRLLEHNGQALIFGLPTRFQDRLDAQGGIFLQGLPRSAPPQVELSAPDGRIWRLPAGSLSPEKSAWTHQLDRNSQNS